MYDSDSNVKFIRNNVHLLDSFIWYPKTVS